MEYNIPKLNDECFTSLIYDIGIIIWSIYVYMSLNKSVGSFLFFIYFVLWF